MGLQHLAFVGVGAAFSVAAPGGGAPVLMGVLAATGALLWLAVPQRPALRGLQVRLDPLLAPVAAVGGAVDAVRDRPLVSGVVARLTTLAAAVALTATSATVTALVAVQLQSLLWVPGFVPVRALVPLLYPDGLLPGRRWRAAAVASLVGTGALLVGMSLYPEPFVGTVTMDRPVVAQPAAQVLVALATLLLVPSVMAGAASLLVRLRRSGGLRRRQVVVLLVAGRARQAGLGREAGPPTG